MSFNFITRHLISKIEDMIVRKQHSLKCDGFFYFDEVINDSRMKIDRINRWNVFQKEEILPVSWYMLDSKTLIKIFHMIKHNKFYGYVHMDKKDFKVRLKASE